MPNREITWGKIVQSQPTLEFWGYRQWARSGGPDIGRAAPGTSFCYLLFVGYFAGCMIWKNNDNLSLCHFYLTSVTFPQHPRRARYFVLLFVICWLFRRLYDLEK